MIYVPLVLLFFFFSLRRLESMVTYHPVRYQPGSVWMLPPNGEELWIDVTNNQRIHGWLIRSDSKPAIATILYLHGNGGNLTDVGWFAQKFAKTGFDTLLIDYRGYGRSDGEITDEKGLNADGQAAYDYLIRERGVSPAKLALYGLSLGSTVAIDLASRNHCGALIVESGLSSASDMGAVAFPWLPRFIHFLARNKFESERKIAKVKCPVLIAHSTDDPVIPVDQGYKLHRAAPEPKRLLVFPNGSHNIMGMIPSYIDAVTDYIGEAVSK